MISKAVFSDAKKIAELVQNEFPYVNASGQKIKSRLENPNIEIFKISEKKELAGIIDLEILPNNTGRINGLAVLEKFRGKNFGKKLLKKGISFFSGKNFDKIILLVGKDNGVAKSLYKSYGFEFSKRHFKKISGNEVEEFELALEKNQNNSII